MTTNKSSSSFSSFVKDNDKQMFVVGIFLLLFSNRRQQGAFARHHLVLQFVVQL
jgi:hypothetical protein